MTINGFSPFSTKYLKGSLFETTTKELEGGRVAIDLYLLLFQMRAVALKEVANPSSIKKLLSSGKREDEDMFEWISKKTNEVAKRKLYQRIIFFLREGWELIFCLDSNIGHPLREKVKSRRGIETAKRRSKIEELKEKLKSCDLLLSAPIIADLSKFLQQDVSESLYNLVQRIASNLKCIGFPVIYPEDIFVGNFPPDGEAVAATLTAAALVDAVYTTDADAHTYGSTDTICITKMNDNRITLRKTEDMLSLMAEKEEVEEITLLDFQVAAILAGVDYNDNIAGIAFGKSLKLVATVSTKLGNDMEFLVSLIQLHLFLEYEIDSETFLSDDPFDWSFFFSRSNIPNEDEFRGKFNKSKNMKPVELLDRVVTLIEAYKTKDVKIGQFIDLIEREEISFQLVFPLYRSTTISSTKIVGREDLVSFDKKNFEENALEVLKMEDSADLFPVFKGLLARTSSV